MRSFFLIIASGGLMLSETDFEGNASKENGKNAIDLARSSDDNLNKRTTSTPLKPSALNIDQPKEEPHEIGEFLYTA